MDRVSATTPEPYPSESAAVQDWIDGNTVTCRCGRPMTRIGGSWYHRGLDLVRHEAGPSIADSECGTCHRTWDSVTTPTPAARCPFEYDHPETDPEPDKATRVGHYAALYAALEDDAYIWDDSDVPPVTLVADMDPPDRWCLVERSVGESRRYVTLHTSREQAGDYHYGQEYPHDWDIEDLVDLDTGERWTEAGVVVNWERVPGDA